MWNVDAYEMVFDDTKQEIKEDVSAKNGAAIWFKTPSARYVDTADMKEHQLDKTTK